ncbi:helix-turn-helix domain-containing protein [Streptococcus sp. DD12]|uniref:helix-turn-helix domain-containing protein n=1 Tax=Streptococcus sp. DD12 TaxID=1777880 RepID=UPI000794BAE7|nr:helix-turn-helix domain-containing protein [Streptococcus sp. DD12]KXT75298.1 Transcriptional regulator [Streptococcus sp. DD12]
MLGTLGNRIKTLRKEKKLSREAICEDGEVLSPKQLYRIEANISMPSVEKVVFLAKQLDVSVSELFDEKKELPQEYLSLKYDILNTQVYRHPDLMTQVLKQISDVHERFYADLPQEEAYIFGLLEKMLRAYNLEEDQMPITEIKEHLRPLLNHLYFDLNTLIMIRYVLNREISYDEKYKKSLFGASYIAMVQEELVNLTTTVRREDWFICRDNLITALTLSLNHADHEKCFLLLKVLKENMARFQDVQKKMIVMMLEWKIFLLNNQLDEAQETYDKTKAFVQIIGDKHVLMKIMEEWESDFKDFQKKKEI